MVRRAAADWEVAIIEPAGNHDSQVTDKNRPKAVTALPKGLVDPGEKPEQTALREVREETGIAGAVVTKLLDIRYVYVRNWGDKARVFKIVSFYLLPYVSGEIDDVSGEMRIEVKRALWIPLAEAQTKLSYKGERDAIRKAREYLQSHGEEAG